MVGTCLIQIAKAGAVTLIVSKSLKCFGKRDYADIIKFSGICIMGVPVINLIRYFIENPPWFIKVIQKIF
ncbi:hypothetical protein [Clostridium brassicae]|uniref:Uncharacterized protein n=1 Tax=Clostridium brassicae TaxID=2999072 RepID=A0ABT4D9S4_9CLOT|nr:hypothetical protein [Clostridium brassicae]MCY6957981.1 hypothetical protein [Clostridium brassicae]